MAALPRSRARASEQVSSGCPRLAALGSALESGVLGRSGHWINTVYERQWNICLKMDADAVVDYEGKSSNGQESIKVICLGDSAVGKSK